MRALALHRARRWPASRRARAYDFEIDAETIGQAYQLRAADDTLVNRRRLDPVPRAARLQPGPARRPRPPAAAQPVLPLVSMRFDAELGDFPTSRADRAHAAARALRRAARSPLRLRRRPRHRRLPRLRARPPDPGRPLRLALVRRPARCSARTPFHVAVEAWGGLNVTGAGVVRLARLSRRRRRARRQPARLARRAPGGALQPTFGVAARPSGCAMSRRASRYERTMSPTGDRASRASPSWGVVDEQVGLTARGKLFDGADPLVRLPLQPARRPRSTSSTPARARQLGRHGLSAEYVLAAPTFDGDSIWNVFASQAFDDVRVAYDVRSGSCRAYARGFTRLFFDDNGTSRSRAAARSAAASRSARAAGRASTATTKTATAGSAPASICRRACVSGATISASVRQRLRRGAPVVRLVPRRLAARRSRRLVRRAGRRALDAARRHHRARPRRGERQPHLLLAAARAGAARSLVLARVKPRGIRRPQPWSGL